ncbi:MAG TPA: N-acetylmuramic acid 6-phosphate etherase, partial [Longimicrobiales bacterium]
PNDFALGIATSGTTPYVHGALRRARELGARTGFLLCTYPSEELHKAHDVVIAPLVGPEVITGSTRMKAGTATKMVLNTITTSSMVLLGKVFGNLMVDLQVTCQKLQDRGERILMETTGVERDTATDLLERADGHVKTAIVMSKLGVDQDEARKRLHDSDDVLVRVVGDIEI